jgi:predicted secreted protein
MNKFVAVLGIVIVLLSCCFVVFVEADSLWTQTFGETTTEGGYCVVETLDGGYAMVGIADHVDGDYDLWLIKTDAYGNMEWNQTYQASFLVSEFSLIATSDGGYAIATHKKVSYPESSTNLAYDFWLIKTDAYGNMEWNKTYGGPELDLAQSVVEASDGGFVLVGETRSFGAGEIDFWMVKTDANGNMQWHRTFGGTDFDWCFSLVSTSDGGYAIAGITRSFGFEEDTFWLIKTDAHGNAEWKKTCGGNGVTGGDLTRTCSLVTTSDGGYALVSKKASAGSGWDFFLVKTDASGNVEWNRTYGGTETEWSKSMVAASDGGYAIAGFTKSFGAGGHDWWVVKTNSAGDMEWNHTYGWKGYDAAESLVAASDGGYAICGRLEDDLWLVKTDMNGNMEWNQTYSGTKIDVAYSVVATSDGGYAIAGVTSYYGAEQGQCLALKTNDSGNTWEFFPASISGNGTGHKLIETSGGDYAVAGYTGAFSGNADFLLWWFEPPADFSMIDWKTYGGPEVDVAYSLVEASDGGYAIVGFTESFGAGGADFWLVKTDVNRNMEWNQTYGGTGDERAYSVVKTADGGYAIAGETSSFGSGGTDFWLIKTDDTGNIEWNQTYGGPANEASYSLVEAFDGGYALVGFTESFGAGGADFWLVKTDADGNMEWNQTYGGQENDFAHSLVKTSYVGYALAGETKSLGAGSTDFWLIETDEFGNLMWNETYGGEGSEVAYSLVETTDGGYLTVGYTNSFGDGYGDMWLVKTGETGITPEYSSWIVPSLLFAATLVIVITKKRRQPLTDR